MAGVANVENLAAPGSSDINGTNNNVVTSSRVTAVQMRWAAAMEAGYAPGGAVQIHLPYSSRPLPIKTSALLRISPPGQVTF